jgi:hypothetical protein
MESVKWFVERLEEMAGERVLMEEVGFEAVELFQRMKSGTNSFRWHCHRGAWRGRIVHVLDEKR